MARISVIIAAYNPGNFLEATVRSICDQTFTDWELFVIDDGSTQDISDIADKFPSIHYIRQENRGLSIARNVGIMASSGEYLAFCDQDDVWQPTKLALQIELLDKNKDIGLCYTNFEMIDSNGTPIGPGFEGGAESYLTLLHGCCICGSMVVIRRECLAVSGLFDPFYIGSQDYDMWLKIARYYKIKYIPSIQGYYRRHSQNLSLQYAMLYSEGEDLFRKHIAVAKRQQDKAAEAAAEKGFARIRLVYGSQAFDHCRRSFRQRSGLGFIGHFKNAVRLAPQFVLASLLQFFDVRRRALGSGISRNKARQM